MQTNPRTTSVHFAVFHASFPNQRPRTYLEVPLISSVCSLAATTAHFKELDLWNIMPRAFITLEFSEQALSDTAWELIRKYRTGYPEAFINYIKKPALTLVNKILDQPKAEHASSEVETIHLQVLCVGEHVDTIPGIYLEVSQTHCIAEDIAGWEGVDTPPDEIVGHITIEVYSAALLPEARNCLESIHEGEPEGIEALLGHEVVSVFLEGQPATQ